MKHLGVHEFLSCVLHNQVAHRMSKPLADLALRPESAVDIRRSCKEDLDHYPDVTLHLQLQLQLAIANDDFERAAQCARSHHFLLAFC